MSEVNEFLSELSGNTKQTVLSDFIPIKKIGEGSFSSVYKVRRISDGEVYALKKVKIKALKEKEQSNALNQIRILASLESPYIISYKEAFFDQKLSLLCIVMELADQGDLQKRIYTASIHQTFIPEKQIWKAILHIAQGLHLLHSKNILHRDIKTANIFLSNSIYKLGDLNVSKVQDLNKNLAITQTGTPYYASPQIWRDEPYDGKSDIWSMGCIIYEMCAFKPPFQGQDIDTLYKSIQRGSYQPIPTIYSKDLIHFIACCLNKNPKARLSAKEMITKSNSILLKKCLQFHIQTPNQYSSCKLLETIKFTSNVSELNQKLPQSKYEMDDSSKASLKRKHTKETLQKSTSIKHNRSEEEIHRDAKQILGREKSDFIRISSPKYRIEHNFINDKKQHHLNQIIKSQNLSSSRKHVLPNVIKPRAIQRIKSLQQMESISENANNSHSQRNIPIKRVNILGLEENKELNLMKKYVTDRKNKPQQNQKKIDSHDKKYQNCLDSQRKQYYQYKQHKLKLINSPFIQNLSIDSNHYNQNQYIKSNKIILSKILRIHEEQHEDQRSTKQIIKNNSTPYLLNKLPFKNIDIQSPQAKKILSQLETEINSKNKGNNFNSGQLKKKNRKKYGHIVHYNYKV